MKDDLAVFPLVDIGFSSLGLRSSPFMGYWIHWILAMMGLFLFLTQYSIIHLRCRWVHVRMLDAFVELSATTVRLTSFKKKNWEFCAPMSLIIWCRLNQSLSNSWFYASIPEFKRNNFVSELTWFWCLTHNLYDSMI